MSGYAANIERETLENKNFRKVVFTGLHSQLVLMSLKPGEKIEKETHPKVDQFFRFEQGKGRVTINGIIHEIYKDCAVIVPAGSEHEVENTGEEDLKLYTIYSPSNHPDGTTHATKGDADAYELEHHKE